MKKRLFRGMFPGFALAIIIAGAFFIFDTEKAAALPVEVTVDTPSLVKDVKTSVWEAVVKAGRVSFTNALRSLINQFAYDTATYIGSGGQGQKPVYFTEQFGPWLLEQGYNAGGQFIEEFAKADTVPSDFINKYNICSPDLSVAIKISLGLTDYAKDSNGLSESRCNLKKIYESGVNQIEAYRDPNYLANLAQVAFDPATTDVGATLTLFDKIDVRVQEEKTSKQLNRQEGGGWLDITNLISGWRTAPPGENESKLEQVKEMQTQGFFTQTGDIFVDAANIFLNQLAISAFNRLIDNLSRNTGGSDAAGNFYAQGGSRGITDLARQNSTLLQAQFNERNDYDVLSQLSSCTDESKPGPTNCVITQQFAQAISQQLTIAEAVNRGIIDAKKRIGFDQQGNDISFRDGYPYRSLIILRKYRILPVGWEVAAQYIKDFPGATRDVTLGDLISCFDKNDSYTGYYSQWCEGMIDPNWVLKIPKMFCGMEGYGPEILSQQLIPSSIGYCTDIDKDCNSNDCKTNYAQCTTNSQCSGSYSNCNFTYSQMVQIDRNQNYCADEQSCIKENPNGSCAYFGYCTEEKRLWKFSQNTDNSCEARNNTCQSFKSMTGQEVSYLENTLDFANCSASQVGCQRYASLATGYANGNVTWNATAGQNYFNKNITACEASGEGCHEFVRAKEGMDTNLVADGDFELSSCITSIQEGPGEDQKEGGQENTGEAQSRNSLIKTAYAQSSNDECQTQSFTSSGYLNAPNQRWYVAVDSGTVRAGVSTVQHSQGGNSMFIEGNGGLYSKDSSAPSLLPAGFVMEPNTYYTLSANVYVEAGTARLGFGNQAGQYVDWNTTGSWKSLTVILYNPESAPIREFFIKGTSSAARFYVDQIQFTKGRASSSYNDYLSANVIYQKLLPAYLESVCYTGTRRDGGSEFELKADAPSICYQFARKCAASEVGCESYTALDSGITVTGKAKPKDTCSTTCVGYNTFVQQANAFNQKEPAYFIPQTARSCSAQAVGCTAFTNLDKLDQGGEAVEYYTAMRSCIKPDASACGQFYTWEGSDESGYQLRVYSLKKNGNEPASTLTAAQEAQLCNAEVYTKEPTEPGYNYDCRQFYAADGTVSYHLNSKTISCSDDCHPYRREVASAAECTNNGGIWETAQSRCIYNAIPGEGTTCAAAQAGCQEYAGNISNNTRDIFSPSPATFEDVNNQLEGWRGGSRSNVALNAGGHSLFGTSFEKAVGASVTRNRSYTVSFLAKAVATNTTVRQLSLVNNQSVRADFTTSDSAIKTDWQLYTFNLSTLDHEVTAGNNGAADELLQLQFSGQVYLDNIRLTEVPDRYYLIKNSWNTPAECDQDFTGASSPRYMLGCSLYQKADRSTVALRSFSELCQDSAAGCEAMIDTRNSSNPSKSLVNDTNNNGACDQSETDCVQTPADAMLNVVYDPTKQCGQAAKGCQRFGVATTYDNVTTFETAPDAYLKNDPDVYTSTVCTAAGLGCSQYTTASKGTVYFKDPKNEVCEWRLKAGTAAEYGWFKKGVKRCGGVTQGDICTANADCNGSRIGSTCQEVPCDVTANKTLGSSGNGKQVVQPSNWAGTCEPAQAGCTEYIDPLSKSNINLVKNPSYEADTTGTGASFWVSEPNSQASQRLSLKLHTVYILKGGSTTDASDETYIKDCRTDANEALTVYQLQSSTNTFEPVASGTTAVVGGMKSVEFYVSPNSVNSSTTDVSCTIMRKNVTTGRSVELRQAIVGYQLEQNLDKETPNGLTSFSKGYIMFNERSQSGAGKAQLKYNADATPDVADGTAPNVTAPMNANVIVKAQSDRVCSKWLSCNTYVVDPNNPSQQKCLDVGLCDSFDSEGKCNNFISAPTMANQDVTTLGSASAISNLTGYSKVGYRRDIQGRGDVSSSLAIGYYNFANMAQAGDTVTVENGSFEKQGSWQDTLEIIWDPRKIGQERLNPYHILKGAQQKAATNLPPVGQGMAKLNNSSASQNANAALSLVPGRKYVVSSFIYNQGASIAEVRLVYQAGGGPAERTLITTDQQAKNAWAQRTAAFTAPTGSNFQLKLVSREGASYFDDVKVESGLNIKCSGNNVSSADCVNPEDANTLKRPWYISSICRLYPKAEALGCDYTENNVTNLGLKGYCLEYDPKSPDVCLLWYPLDKIASDTIQEGVGLNFSNPLYYCDRYAPEPRYVYRIPEFTRTSSSAHDDQCGRTACGAVGGSDPGEEFYCISHEGNTPCNGDQDYYYNCQRKDGQDTAGWYDIPSDQELRLNGDTTYTGSIISSFGFNCSSGTSVTVNDPFVCSRITNNPASTSCTISDELIRRQFDDAVYYDHCAVFNSKCKSLTANFDDLKKPRSYCSRVVKVNKDKPWNNRLSSASSHKVKCYTFANNQALSGLCGYSADAIPFGSAYLTNPNLDPAQWVSPEEIGGNALVWRPANSGYRMGATIEAGSSPYYLPSLFVASTVGADTSKPFASETRGTCVGGGNAGAPCTSNTVCNSFNCAISYQGLQPYAVGNLPRCNGARPAYDENNPQASYCYIEPTVSDMKINGTNTTDVWLRGAEEVAIAFTTKTDSEQLPLRNISVDLGYKNSDGSQATASYPTGSYGDGTRTMRQVYNYSQIRRQNDNLNQRICSGPHSKPEDIPASANVSCNDRPCCILKPSITIQDNWSETNTVSFNKYLILEAN